MSIDKDCVDLCQSIYGPSEVWDKLWTGDIYAGLKNNILCFRGSVTAEDWFRDLDAVATTDKYLGGIHAGFSKGVAEFQAEILSNLPVGLILTGHSLGAARAVLFGAWLTSFGRPPAAIVVFGCPRVGFLRLSEVLQPLIILSYKNRYDPVTDVPVPFYPDLPYTDVQGRIQIDVEPSGELLNPLADHSINLYAQGVTI